MPAVLAAVMWGKEM